MILELLKGAGSDKDYSTLKESLDALVCLDVKKEVWERAFTLSLELRKKGASIPATDILISAVALHYGCKLLHNDKHFTLVAKKSGLKEV